MLNAYKIRAGGGGRGGGNRFHNKLDDQRE